MRMSEDQASELLDVMREHGWSETGQDHDPVRWLRIELEERPTFEAFEQLQDEAESAEQDLKDASNEIADLQRDLQKARAELTDLRREQASNRNEARP